MRTVLLNIVVMCLLVSPAYAREVVCQLLDKPASLIKLCPDCDHYEVKIVRFTEREGGQLEYNRIWQQQMKDTPVHPFESRDNPQIVYVLYDVDNNKIGYVYGVVEAVSHGDMELFVFVNLEGKMQDAFLQKFPSEDGAALDRVEVLRQFVQLNWDKPPVELPKLPEGLKTQDAQILLRAFKLSYYYMGSFLLTLLPAS